MNPKTKERIKNLLRLAQDGANIHEAANAFAMAQEIATNNNLNLDDISVEDCQENPVVETVDGIETRQVQTWKKSVIWKLLIAGAVAKANSCDHFYTQAVYGKPATAAGFGRPGASGGISFFGQSKDLDIAEFVYKEIIRIVDIMALQAMSVYKSERKPWEASARSYGNAWRRGCSDAIRARMKSPEETVKAKRLELEGQVNALVRVDRAEDYLKRVNKAVESYLKTLEVKSSVIMTSAGRGSQQGYEAGRDAGSSMSLGSSKAIE